jgi:hypothetical protein
MSRRLAAIRIVSGAALATIYLSVPVTLQDALTSSPWGMLCCHPQIACHLMSCRWLNSSPTVLSGYPQAYEYGVPLPEAGLVTS